MSNKVTVEIALASLMEIENTSLNLSKEMELLRHMDENVRNVFLDIPQLPTDDTNEFKRTEPPSYRAKVEEIINDRMLSKKYDYNPKNGDNVKTSEPPSTDT